MNILNRDNNNFSTENMEKAEILEAYTRKLKGERLSRFQNKLLKSNRYDEELVPLKDLITYAHDQAEKEAFTTEIVVPRPGAARRVKTKISELISDRKKKSYGRFFPITPSAMIPEPIYDIDPKGSDSELEVTVYDEPILPVSNGSVLKFKIIEGDEKDHKYSVTLSKPIIDDGNQISAESQRCMTIGRGSSAKIQISDSSHKLSREHARLDTRNGSVYITDLGSTNGTYINGVRVTDSAKLSPGSIVKLGGVIIQILSIDKVS